jgi:outer membrane lipoprotein-sorting protein
MKRNSLYLFLILTVLCAGMFSCAKREVLRGELHPYEGPVNLDVLKQSAGLGNVESIKAFADVTVLRQNEKQSSLNGVFAYKAPGKMRINLFGPFGLTATEILISEGLIQLSIPSQNLLYEGNVPGVHFTGAMNGNFVYEMKEEADGYILLGRSRQQETPVSAVYYFDRSYLLNRTMNIYRNGSDILKTVFSDFNGRTPERMRLAFANGLSLDIRLKEPELDSEIPDAYFSSIESAGKKVRSFQEIFRILLPAN